MAYRRNQNDNYYKNEDPFNEGDNRYRNKRYQPTRREREVSEYHGDQLHHRTAQPAGIYDQFGMHSTQWQDYSHGDHKSSRYNNHQGYDEPLGASYRGRSRGAHRETSQHHGERPRESESSSERVRIQGRRNIDYRTERKTDHFSHYYEQSSGEYAESGSTLRNKSEQKYSYEKNRYRQSEDFPEYKYSSHSNRHVKKYSDRVTYEREDNQTFPQNYTSDSSDSYRRDNHTYSHRGNTQCRDREDRDFIGSDNTHGNGKIEEQERIQYSQRETVNRSVHRSSEGSRSSSHGDVYDYHTEHRASQGTCKQHKPYSTGSFREGRHEKHHTSATVNKHEPLFKETHTFDDGKSVRGARERASGRTSTYMKHKPRKEMSFSNFSDNQTEQLLTNMSSDERIVTKGKGVGLLRTPSQSPEDDNDCRGLLATPYTEGCNTTVKSAGLLPTPTDIDVDSSHQTEDEHPGPIEYQREDPGHVSAGLLPTPTVSPDEDFKDISTGLLSTQKWSDRRTRDHSKTLIPPPGTEVGICVQKQYEHPGPVEYRGEGPGYISTGLLPTPTVSPDEDFDNISTGLLSAPTWSDDRSQDHLKTVIIPTPETEVDNCVQIKYEHPDPMEYKREDPVHLSSELLPTPKVSPDEEFKKSSKGRLSSPRWSTNTSPEHSTTPVIPPSACSPFDDFSETGEVPADRVVETVVYPSKGLLPTPKGSPTISISSHPFMQHVDSVEDTEKFHNNTEVNVIDSENTLSSGSEMIYAEDSRKSFEEDVTTGSGIRSMNSQENSLMPNEKHVPLEVNVDKIILNEKKQSTELQILENIQVQLQLAKALESMQKTMNTLQKKIHEDKDSLEDKKEKCKVNEKQNSLRKEKKNVIEVNDDTDCVEISDEIEGVASDNPVNISSEFDSLSVEVPVETQDNNTCQQKLKTGPDKQTNEKESASNELLNKHCASTETKSKELLNGICKNQANKSTARREYKTYKEWRLAKERMNKYFYNKSSESEGSTRKDSERIQNCNVKYNYNRIDTSCSKASSPHVKVSDPEQLTNNRDTPSVVSNDFEQNQILNFKNPGNGSGQRRELASKHSDSRDIGENKSQLEVKMEDALDSVEINEKHLIQIEGGKQERKHSTTSNEGFTDRKLEKKNSVDFDTVQRKHSNESDNSLIHKHLRSEIYAEVKIQDKTITKGSEKLSEKLEDSKKEKNQSGMVSKSHRHSKSDKEKSDNLDNNMKINHKLESSHRGRHHSTESHSKVDSDSRKTSMDKRYSADSKSSHHSKEDVKHSHENSKSKGHHSERSEKHKTSRSEKSHRHHHHHTHHSSSKEKDRHHSRLKTDSGVSGKESQTNDCERNLKNVFVKLSDINKGTEKNSDNPKTIENTPKGNIFEKMSQNISSLKRDKSATIANKSNYHKDNIKTDSNKRDQTLKPVVTESEDSSTEVDPFEKMNFFLNKDKRRPGKSLVQKRSTRRSENFIVSDDHISDSERNDLSKSEPNETPQNSSYGSERKRKEFVKHLKRLNNTLCWRGVKLVFPRINLQRLSNSDIRRLKSKLKESKKPSIGVQVRGKSVNAVKNVLDSFREQKQGDKTPKLDKEKSVEINTGVSENKEKIRKKTAEYNLYQEKGIKLKEFSVPVNKITSNENEKLVKRTDALHTYTEEKTDKYCESSDNNLSDNTKDSLTDSSQNLNGTQTKSTLDAKTNITVSVGSKQNTNDQNSKKYKRIVSVECSSTEQSESSDIERIVCVSQRVKPGPVIFDSDESEKLEGSLGSEDSTCFDLTDESEEEQSVETNEKNIFVKENVLDGTVSDLKVQTDLSSVVKEQSATSVSMKDVLFENKKKTKELVTKENEEMGASETDETSPGNAEQLQAKRNIFADMTNECSTASEIESSTLNSSKQIDPEISSERTLVRSPASLAKVTATLGKTLKKLKVNSLQAHSGEESAGPDFCCLPERKAAIQTLNETAQSESDLNVTCSIDEVDGIETCEIVSGQSAEQIYKTREGNSDRNNHDTMTCSESAGKTIKRRKFNDSSTDSSDGEQLLQIKSASKYRKGQLEKTSEEKQVNKQDSKEEIKETQKRSGGRESESSKHVPLRAKRLFRSSANTKRQSTIMQMDGNADLVFGPPEESSGEEGDIEDNVTCINGDSENENSASQDLFADLRLKRMSENFNRVFGKTFSDNAIKNEVENKDIRYVIDNEEASTSKSHKEDNSSAAVSGKENDLPVNDTEKSDDTIKEDIVKNEPDWLKFGYTQELDTIFLSDDDEMEMWVSQPVILVSDEETQDPDATQPLVLDDIKQEKIDDEKYETVDITCENYSSAEDWSDEGSDFEPENMFNSLQRAHNVNTVSDHNSSEHSLFSDDDLFKSQSLLEPNPKNTCNKNDGFESSDGAVMSINEDELLGSPATDETSMSNINEDELLGITDNTKTDEQNKCVFKSEKENEANKDFSSDSDEILLISAYELEDQHKKATNKMKSPSCIKIDKDLIESSQRLEPVCQDETVSQAGKSTKVKEDTPVIESSEKLKAAEINQKQNSLTDKSSIRSPTSSGYQELTPYIQDTQVDPNMSDGDTSNSVTAFDFYSEHFADSDTDSKASTDTETRKNSSKSQSGKNYGYDTLSDDSDIMILDNLPNENEEKTKVEQSSKKKENTSIEIITQTRTKDDISEVSGFTQDMYSCQTQIEHTQTERKCSVNTQVYDEENEGALQDLYFTDTQVEKPGPSSYDPQSAAFCEQTQIDRQESAAYSEQTQIDSPRSTTYGEQTQIDRPGSSDSSSKNDAVEEDIRDTSDSSMSDGDPQSQAYFQNSQFDKNSMKDKIFSQRLGIIFDSFSDSSEEQMENEYDMLTQVDTAAPEHKELTKHIETKTGGVKISNIEKSIGIKKDKNSSYSVLTQVISSAESEDAEDYGAMTQVDPAAKRQTLETQPITHLDLYAYFADTQFEYISESEYELVSEDDGLYDVSTQIDVEDGTERSKSRIKMFELSDSKQDSNNERKRDSNVCKKDSYELSNSHAKSSSRDNLMDCHGNNYAYEAATQFSFDPVSDPEEKSEDEDIYNTATQIDVNDTPERDFFDTIADTEEKCFKKHNTAESKYDSSSDNNEAYDAETLDDDLPDIIPVSTEMEDPFMAATQVDTDNAVSSGKNALPPVRKESNFKKMFESSDSNKKGLYNERIGDSSACKTVIYELSDSDDKSSSRDPIVKQKSVLGSKSILKRPFPESASGKSVSFAPESSAAKKPRVIERKILQIEPQKLKTTAEKRVSGVITGSAKTQNSVSSVKTSNSDIEVLDISKSDMWLSKKVVAKKVLGKGRGEDKIGKRKRRASADDDLRARVMAARSQVKDRSMHNITHPDTIKRLKTAPTATVTSSELEDVTLPTDSQIIRHGLPVLNSTGVILKTHRSVSDSNGKQSSEAENIPGSVQESPYCNVSTATVSTATTTISTAVSASVPHTVQSTSSVTSRVQHRGSDTEKNQKYVKEHKKINKDKDKPKSDKSSVRLEKGHDKTKHAREKVKIDDRENKHGERRHRSTSGDGKSREKTNKERSESGDSIKRGKIYGDKDTDKENDKHVKSSEGRAYDRSYNVDRGSSKDKHGKKIEEKKHSSSKDQRQKHDSGQKKEKERHSSSSAKHSESKNMETYSKNRKDGHRQKTSDDTTTKRSNKEKDKLGCSGVATPAISTCISTTPAISTFISTTPAISTCISTTPAISTGISTTPTVSTSTSSSSAVTISHTASHTIPVTAPSVSTSGGRPLSAVLVNKGQSAAKAIKTVTMATTTTTTSVSRNIARSTAVVRTTASTHIQSSVLLQKQSSKPTTSSARGPNPVPSVVTAGLQPFQPLVSNIPGSAELMPSNMVRNVPNLQWNDFLKVILKWSPNWFEEREKIEQVNKRAPPPDVTADLFGQRSHTLYPLPERYENFKEYSENFMLPLLLHETWESCYSTWRERRSKQRLCQHRLMISQQAPGGDKLLVYTLIGLISERDRRFNNCVSEGDLVKLTINGDLKIDENTKKNMNYTMSGFVDKVTFKEFPVERICTHYKDMAVIRKQLGDCISLKLTVRVRFRAFIPNDKAVVHLESVSTIINTIRQFTALSYLPRSPLCRDLLYPTGNLTYCDKAPASVPGLQEKYNQSQLTAINTAARISRLPREVSRVCLLQGPPGTGKSHTIVGIIQHLVKTSRGPCRICLCAPSHAAVDELLRRLIKYNRTVDKNSTIKMVRLGKKNSVHADIQSYCLDSLVQKNIVQAQKEELLKQLPQSLQGERKALENKIAMVTKNIEHAKEQFQKQKLRLDLKKLEKQKEVLESKYVPTRTNVGPQQERKIKSDLLQRAHVIAGTLSSIGSNVLRAEFQSVSTPAFQVVIIDEATQAIELETLIPLQYGITKLILVGDPEQLPATVLSQVARDNKFNMSLFERLDGHFRMEKVNPVILLDTQYRMDPEISAFPNKYVYDGRIKDDRCVVERNQLPLVPYLLFDVCEGRELFSQGTRSMSNPLEAIFTAELCKFIVTESSVIERVIGIIAPYANQKSEILKELGKRGLNSIEVSTVDGFQGREKHVIIMSCVRANVSGAVGFVGNRNRLNVSVTRAKYAMYLVGHFENLECSDEWKALIADARQRRKITLVNQSSMKQAIKMTIKQR